MSILGKHFILKSLTKKIKFSKQKNNCKIKVTNKLNFFLKWRGEIEIKIH